MMGFRIILSAYSGGSPLNKLRGLTLHLAGFNPAGTVGDLSGAKLLRIQLPLDDGRSPAVRIEPQDPAFQKFLRQCNATPA
jgi:hypothetical protein